MKQESFFIGPSDEDITVQMDLSLKDTKLIYGILVDCFHKKQYSARELQDIMLNLNKIIKQTLTEHSQQTEYSQQ
jgi:hypothetical protein